MDRLLNGLVNEFADGGWPWGVRSQPAVNVWEKPEALIVEMEVPGVESNQIDMAVVGNELTIKVEQPTAPEQEVTFHRRERPAGAFSRVLRLPIEVAADKVEADLRNGVLTITLPKAETARPRKIPINSTT
jgi:HSP20 family protein